MNKKVTCIITSYKKFDYIFSAVDSVLLQDYPDIELIICDDCSGNFPEAELKAYIEKNKRENLKDYIVYSNKENLGTVKNFNTAARKATGYYFVDLSADDTFYDDQVFKHVAESFEKTGALCATCAIVMTGGGRKQEGRCLQTNHQKRLLQEMTPNQLFDRISRDNIMSGASHYFTREAIEKFGLYDEKYKYIEDLPRFLQLTREGYKIHFFAFPTVRHRMDGISNTKTVPLRYIEDNLAICRNEILKYRGKLSLFSYRYNLCREESLVVRMNNNGCIPIIKKMKLGAKYPDAMIYNIFTRAAALYGEREHFNK